MADAAGIENMLYDRRRVDLVITEDFMLANWKS